MLLEANIAPYRTKSAEHLFEPIRLGRMTLPHRVAMAPLTRSRARQPGNVPTPLNAAYYVQRACAALIISEATQVSMQGQGAYAWTPGIHSREQIEGWRLVTDAVHAVGGRMFLQLWHVGRISPPGAATGWGATSRAICHPPGRSGIHRERSRRARTRSLRHAKGARSRRDALHRPAVRTRRSQCARRRFRWC